MSLPPPARYVLLPLASVLTGMLAGFIGYLMGQYFYMLFLYPFILMAIGIILYFPSHLFFKTSSSLFNAFCGFLLGLMVLLVFHYVEYSLFLTKNMNTFKVSQGMTQSAASRAVDTFLQTETGLGGFGGFMRYENSQMNPYMYYDVDPSGRITSVFKIYLHNKTGRFYLAGETLVLLGGPALISLLSRRIIPIHQST